MVDAREKRINATDLPGNLATLNLLFSQKNYAIRRSTCILITEADGGPWPTRDVLPMWMFGAASGVYAISITEFSAPANGRRGWEGIAVRLCSLI